MQLTDSEKKQIKSTIRRMQKVLSFAFPDRSNIYIGYYALMTSKYLVSQYFDEDCTNAEEFKAIRKCIVNDLSEYTKTIFSKEFKGDK